MEASKGWLGCSQQWRSTSDRLEGWSIGVGDLGEVRLVDDKRGTLYATGPGKLSR